MKSVAGGVPVAPSMEPAVAAAGITSHETLVGWRTVFIALLSAGLAVVAGGVAIVLQAAIALITHIAYYGKFSLAPVSPADNQLGVWAVAVPIVGAVIVGLMARFGSQAIRGHGIPEAMEQILFNESRIPARLTFLKPLSAAIAIGTGGPFGAEGPIIATGGSLGSLLGQILHTTPAERKTLLSAGAAAGMTATFGSPISAVLLAVELLLFEFRPRSFVPVAIAATVAAGIRAAWSGSAPVFAMPALAPVSLGAIAIYTLEGAVLGLVSVAMTRILYWIEDGFEHLPVHWMWWPALGAIAVGVCGLLSPHTLGVGYDNIEHILAGNLVGSALLVFSFIKFISWSIALGSGTSGGTLAPIFTIGGGLGAAIGAALAFLLPSVGIDPRMAALVGMAATFAGASRALLASIVFAFEVTRQEHGLIPLLGGCTASFVVSALFMKHTIMTEKIARRGRVVPSEYVADPLSHAHVHEFASRDVVVLQSTESLQSVRERITSVGEGFHHGGFPVVDASGQVLGVVTRRDILDPARGGSQPLVSALKRPAVVASPHMTLRRAADIMARERVGRLPVIENGVLVGILSRSDLFAAHAVQK